MTERNHISDLSSVAIVLVLIAAGVTLLGPKFQTNRPNVPAHEAGEALGAQDVRAQLWQDPLQVVALSKKLHSFLDAYKPGDVAHAETHEIEALEGIIGSMVAERRPLLILPVLIPGGDHATDRETRRRQRRAVVSAFGRRRYVPRSATRIGFIRTEWCSTRWGAVLCATETCRQACGRTVVIDVPFEVFDKSNDTGQVGSSSALVDAPQSVIAIWLIEDVIGTQTISMLESLLHRLLDGVPAHERLLESGLIRLNAIGPSSSTTVIGMLQELDSADAHLEVAPDRALELLDEELRDSNLTNEIRTRLDKTLKGCCATSLELLNQSIEVDKIFESAKGDQTLDPNLRESWKSKTARWRTRVLTGEFPHSDYTKLNDLLVSRAISGHRTPSDVVPSLVTSPTDAGTVKSAYDGPEREVIEHRQPTRMHVNMFSPRSTASEQLLLSEAPPYDIHKRHAPTGPWRSPVGGYFESRGEGIQFWNVIPKDDVLAQLIADELSRRGFPFADHRGHIALIGEWDTFYGRALPTVFAETLRSKYAAESCERADRNRCLPRDFVFPDGRKRVHRFAYLRGLDGAVPGATQESDEADHGGQGDGRSASVTRLLDGDTNREWAWGRNQLDYLRRLATRMTSLERSLRSRGESLLAIGVLGSDFYDKELILQALRSEFPDAIFFTTDLDASFSHPAQYQWSRNLVVASGFGLQLNSGLQESIPPFRDSYETATFLAAQVALAYDGTADGAEAGCGPVGLAPRCVESLLEPGLYEVGRTGIVELSTGSRPTGLYRQMPQSGIVASLISIRRPLVSILVLLCGLFVARRVRVANSAVALGTERLQTYLALGVYVLAFTSYFFIASRSSGEPFRVLSGVSIWPTEVLRILIIGLSVVFTQHSWRALEASTKTLSRFFFLDQPELRDGEPGPGRWAKIRLWFSARWKAVLACQRETEDEHQKYVKAQTVWNEYRSLGRLENRVFRAILGTFVVGCIVFVIAWLFAQEAIPPARGALARNIDTCLLYASSLAVLFLTMFVVDAIRVTSRLTRRLGATRTDWGNSRSRILGSTDERAAAEAIDIRFVAALSDSVGVLVFYPFILLFLMTISFNTYFDNWRLPAAVLVGIVTLSSIAIASAMMMRRSAEAVRAKANARLRKYRMEAEPSEQIEVIAAEIEGTANGAFAPWSQHPVIRAVLMPFGGIGFVAIIEYMAITGF